jgi:transposase InsO family protein
MLERMRLVVRSDAFAEQLAVTDPDMTPVEVEQEICALVEEFRDIFVTDFVVSSLDIERPCVAVNLRPDAKPVYRKPYRLSENNTRVVREAALRNIRLGRMRLLTSEEKAKGWNAAARGRVSFKPRKCNLLVLETVFLGRIISGRGIRPDPKHTAAIRAFERPRDVAAVRRLMGLANWMSRHVERFGDIVAPLSDLLKKGVRVTEKWQSSPVYEQSFERLKRAMVEDLELAMPDFTRTFYLATDASDYAVGGVLYQVHDVNGEAVPRPIAFVHRKLTEAQRLRWIVTEKEAYAIVLFTHELRHYLRGNRFVLHTDHAALIYMFARGDPSMKVMRWALKVADYDFDLMYIPGKDNIVADALSRMTREPENTPEGRWKQPWTEAGSRLVYLARGDRPAGPVPSRAQLIVRKMWESSTAIGAVEMISAEGYLKQLQDLIPSLKAEQHRDLLMRAWICRDAGLLKTLPNVKEVRKTFTKHLSKMTVVDGVLYRLAERPAAEELEDELPEDALWTTGNASPALQLVIPHAWRKLVLQAKHDDRHAGHRGAKATLAGIVQRYWWPSVVADVKNHVASCIWCARKKTPTMRPIDGKLHSVPLVTRPFARMSVDLLKLKQSNEGYVYWLICVDYSTRYCRVVPLADATAASACVALYERVLVDFGPPEELLSDNGPEFIAALTADLCRVYGIQRSFITAYNAKANGLVERANRSFLQTLRTIMPEDRRHDWHLLLPAASYAYNTAVNATTGFTPFFLMYGREASDAFDAAMMTELGAEMVLEGAVWIKRLAQARLMAAKSTLKSQVTSQRRWALSKQGVIKLIGDTDTGYAVGDTVMIRHPTKKQLAWEGGVKSNVFHKFQDRSVGPLMIVSISPVHAWVKFLDDQGQATGPVKRVLLTDLRPIAERRLVDAMVETPSKPQAQPEGSDVAGRHEALEQMLSDATAAEASATEPANVADTAAAKEEIDEEPEAPIESGDALYVIESIVDYDSETKKFLVKWKGFDASFDSWEPESVLQADVPRMLKIWWQKHRDEQRAHRKRQVASKVASSGDDVDEVDDGLIQQAVAVRSRGKRAVRPNQRMTDYALGGMSKDSGESDSSFGGELLGSATATRPEVKTVTFADDVESHEAEV